MQPKYFIITFFAIVICSSCGKQSLHPLDYAQWITDESHGLLVAQQTPGAKLSLQYKPIDYVIVTREKKKELSETEVQTFEKEINGMQYFTLSVSNTNPESSAQRVTYLQGELQNDLLLIDGTDTLPCLLYQYEPTYNVQPADHILLGFKATADGKAKNKTLVCNSSLLSNTKITLTIKKESIEHIPNLKLND